MMTLYKAAYSISSIWVMLAGLGAITILDSPIALAKSPTLTILHAFSGSDGWQPNTLIFGNDGNLYGTANSDTKNKQGAIFKLSPAGHFTKLGNFSGTKTGAQPNGPLVADGDGNLFGTAQYGGNDDQGAVFELPAAGHLSGLYKPLVSGPATHPIGGLVLTADGTLYGVGAGGDGGNVGGVFAIAPDGTEHDVLKFSDTGYLQFPQAGLTLGPDAALYGTAPVGGKTGYGAVFRVTTDGQYSLVHSFANKVTDGAYPIGAVAFDPQGNIYGAAAGGEAATLYGSIYKITSAGHVKSLHKFVGADGATPEGKLLFDGAKGFYGTTSLGGDHNMGTIFHVGFNGKFETLYSFSGADGSVPVDGLIADAAGSLYGTTTKGGPGDYGVIFKLTR